jgi:hypothetical protein
MIRVSDGRRTYPQVSLTTSLDPSTGRCYRQKLEAPRLYSDLCAVALPAVVLARQRKPRAQERAVASVADQSPARPEDAICAMADGGFARVRLRHGCDAMRATSHAWRCIAG